MFTAVYPRFTPFTHVLPHLVMFTPVYLRFTPFTHVHRSLSMFYAVSTCLPKFIPVLPRLPLFTPCLSTFQPVYSCLPRFIHVLPRLLVFTQVYPCFTPPRVLVVHGNYMFRDVWWAEHGRFTAGPQPDLDTWWRHPHLQNGAHAEKKEGRSLPGSLLRLEVSFPHTTLRAVT